ncbi:MAG: P1 family peptidase [Anaerolineales bacterium]|nr:P1 family peptidase [Anaerolineales bacterium]
MGDITDVSGFKVGHAQDEEALTGCTVILCPPGTVGGVDQRGGAPGTRETDALRLVHLVNEVHAVLLTGGSAFGLDAASGVTKYLEEQEVGFNVGPARVPIVPAAVLFDLGLGDPNVRPDAEMGYAACQNALTKEPEEGNVGAGMGATVGKILSMKQAMKAGFGMASKKIGKGGIVGAAVAVNAFGDIIDSARNQIIAGARGIRGFADTRKVMGSLVGRTILKFATANNTVIGTVATNVKLSKEEVTKVARMAHNGLARAIRPANTMVDGDTVFALASGDANLDVNIVGTFAAQVYEEAILRAAHQAADVKGCPSAASFSG